MPNTTYNLLDDDGLLYAVQYIFTKLKYSPLNVNSTYTLGLDTTNQYIVLTDDQGATSHVSYSDFGDQNIIESAAIDNVDLTITNKKLLIPDAGTNTRGVVSNADINSLINTAIENLQTFNFVKVSSYSALPAAYSNTSTYAVGDLCRHESFVYKCNTAISTAEEWNSAHWDKVSNLGSTIFLVPNSQAAPNIYDEYAWMPIDYTTNPVTYGYEKIGTTSVDLSGYVQYTDISLITNTEIADIVDDAYDDVFNPTP